MNTVLVPIDFSEDSANGLKYAFSLAQETQAELVVLHVTQKEGDRVLFGLTGRDGKSDRLLREKALDLYHLIEKVVRNPGRLKVRRKVVLGNKEEKILGVAKEENIDLVVLGIRKKSFFPYLMARTRLLKMISRFPCPVVLRPPFREPWPQPA